MSKKPKKSSLSEAVEDILQEALSPKYPSCTSTWRSPPDDGMRVTPQRPMSDDFGVEGDDE